MPETGVVDGVKALELEFERQLENMRRLGYPQIADGELEPLRSRLAELPRASTSNIPFVIVLDRALLPADVSMPLVEQDGRPGVVDMNPLGPGAFSAIDDLELPTGPAYLVADVDTGEETLNVTPDAALPLITAHGRSPLTIEEGIAVLTHFPGLLRARNAFSLLGSRAGDKRVAALWTSKGSPRLGWCWAGNPHSWLGSASCATRLGGR